MSKNLNIRDAAKNVAHAPIETVANSTNEGVEYAASNANVESECPISYQVILYQEQVGDGEIPERRAGTRTKTFSDPDPFLARQEAVIYATGLAEISENQHKFHGLKFDSPSEAKSKGYRNYNMWLIEIWLIDDKNKDAFQIYDRAGNPSIDKLGELDAEYGFLESMGYTTDKFFIVKDDDGEIYRCINSKVGLVPFDKSESSELLEQTAA